MVMLLIREIQIYVYENAHSNFNLHSPKLETTQMFVNRRKDRLVYACKWNTTR